MEELVVKKLEPEFKADGWALHATNDGDLQIIAWEDECACNLAFALSRMLKRHALSSNFVQRSGGTGLVVRRLEYFDFAVVVKATQSDSVVSFLDPDGAPLDKGALEAMPGVKRRISAMEDVALHTARSLRAYLATLGVHELELRLHFGIAPDNAMLLQVPNPLECSFGSMDYEALCNALGEQ